MIISASRRTDIPAFYSEWFINRLKEGFLYVRNPINIHQISKIKLTPDVVDFIVFWTKNPEEMLPKLDCLKDYNYYFQYTLTSYDKDIEGNVPSKGKFLIPTFKKLSDKIGKEKIIWRYDPILLSDKYTINYHSENFEKIAKQLSNYTERCTISFLDFYKKTERNLKESHIEQFDVNKKQLLAKIISEIAKEYNLKIDTCSEDIDLSEYGVTHAHCIDSNLMEKLTNYSFNITKDKNQRKECGCVESIDIGAYNTCRHNCKYCYANFHEKQVETNYNCHNPKSPLLYGEISNTKDKITERKVKSIIVRNDYKQEQLNLDL
jgi:DNA repair photolyase